MKHSEKPHTLVFQADGSRILFPLEAGPTIRQVLKADPMGWLAMADVYGCEVFIRLASITDVHPMTQEVLDALKADTVDEGEKWRG